MRAPAAAEGQELGTGEVRAGLGAGAAGGPKEKKVPTWEVVLGQTGRLGNYTAGTTWVPGSLGKAGRQAGRYVIWSTAWQAHNNDAGLARPSCLQHLHVHSRRGRAV